MISPLGWHWAEIKASVVSVPSAGSEDERLFPVPLWVSAGGPQPLAPPGVLILHSIPCSPLLLVSCLCVFSLLFPSEGHSHCIGCPSWFRMILAWFLNELHQHHFPNKIKFIASQWQIVWLLLVKHLLNLFFGNFVCVWSALCWLECPIFSWLSFTPLTAPPHYAIPF